MTERPESGIHPEQPKSKKEAQDRIDPPASQTHDGESGNGSGDPDPKTGRKWRPGDKKES